MPDKLPFMAIRTDSKHAINFKLLLIPLLANILKDQQEYLQFHQMYRKQLTHSIYQFFDRFFIADHLKDSGLLHWKARLLATSHLFILLVAIILLLTAGTLEHGNGTPSLDWPLLFVFPTFYLFKRFGNFILSGNILAAIVAYVLQDSVFKTGGLYSDNLLWMVTVPLLALLFANRVSGFFWMTALIAFSVYLFLFDKANPGVFQGQISGFDNLYYLISYGGLFVMVVGIVMLFATGQAMMLRALDEKRAELTLQKEELIRQAESLRIAEQLLLDSNRDLEQFAYAASHDLKEPLRMIGMYTQLIRKRLGDQLDDSSLEYMAFVTDGVTRMERLLLDLLEYSRLGKKRDRSEDTDLNEILYLVVNNLTVTMRDSEAEILINELPVVPASATEMIQLFQNLIANSIKFRQKDVHPVITVEHQMENNQHRFKLTDNGIGIAPEYREKVFNIFERVHSKKDYEGTGIGLATCKKIVSNMGGNIWVEPAETQGTCFLITFPER